MRPNPLALALLATLAAPVGCSSDSGRRAEADRVLHAVDRLVAADRSDKGPTLRALEGEPCQDPAVCHAKTACVAAFRPLEESARLQREVRAAMATGVASGEGARLPPEQALELLDKTDRAEQAKQASERQVDGCLQEVARLRVNLRL